MRLPHRIKLQKATLSQDNAGQPRPSWSTYRNCWASISDRRAAEEGEQPIEGVVETIFEIRYPHAGPIPQPTHRVVMAEGEITRTWNVEGVRRTDQRRRMVQLIATEVQDG